MANQSPKPEAEKPKTVYHFVVKANKVPTGVRVRPKKFARFDDPVIPRSYWYLTAAAVVAALALGLILGCFVVG